MIRIGQGVDVHAFDGARPLILGGVEIPGSPGLGGHSDADVVCHAVADALLGAACAGDLGQNFPAIERWRNVSSLEILRESRLLLETKGWRIGNVDATVVAEAPKLSPYVSEMAHNVAGVLGVADDAVSVKATTTDGLGFAGRGEGIACFAVALIERS
ncbi:MAG: 2-C-methyl-D-erythritol 2,4-cyclodiphosphate synthase [Actinomycetota bacterium]|jgi:2-C-methyl-D-erythritol 2,4-cyclodiphosphate synthase|nr:2-C-methyl-D-erythritol 2,4-cyclodiphosphate synthase [Actinomycetota bacterium]